jgi:phosphoserine phosphatase
LEPINHNSGAGPTVYWRVEGSLLDLTVVEPVAFFTWNAQTFTERFRRRGLIFLMALLRPFLYSTNRKFATRVVHAVLRGVSRDRLDLLGEEFFQYKLKPRLKERGVSKVQELVQSGADVVLVSQGLEQVMRPLAQHLGVRIAWSFAMAWRRGGCSNR